MPNNLNLPDRFGRFRRLTKGTPHTEAAFLLNRFAYRYRLASDFKGIEAPNVGRTLVGYNIILQLFLSYTAYEALVRAAWKLRIRELRDHSNNSVIDHPLANALRLNVQLKDYLLKQKHNDETRERINAFYLGRHDDVLCIAFAVRNTFAHGDLTASTIGLNKKKHRDSLSDLSRAVLSYCNDHFERCIERL